jgi:putative redox protein
MHATARGSGGGLRSEIDVNGRHVIVTDEPTSLGGTDAGPAPHELLPAALASCIATMISMYAKTKSWDLGEVQVDVDYDHQAVPRRFEIQVHLPDTLTEAQRERLKRVADTCPIRRAMETGFEFDERIVITESVTRRGAAAIAGVPAVAPAAARRPRPRPRRGT